MYKPRRAEKPAGAFFCLNFDVIRAVWYSVGRRSLMNRTLIAAAVVSSVYFASAVWSWRTSVVARAEQVGACADKKIHDGKSVRVAYAECER